MTGEHLLAENVKISCPAFFSCQISGSVTKPITRYVLTVFHVLLKIKETRNPRFGSSDIPWFFRLNWILIYLLNFNFPLGVVLK